MSLSEKELWVYLRNSEQWGRGCVSIRIWLFKASPVVLFGEQGWLANHQGKEGPGSSPELRAEPICAPFSYQLVPSGRDCCYGESLG